MWQFLPFAWRKAAGRKDAPPADAAMVEAAQCLGLDADQAERLGRIAAAMKTGEALSVHAFAKSPRRHLRDLRTTAAQRLVDERAADRPEAVLIAVRDFQLFVETLLRARAPRYATGADLYRLMARDGPPFDCTLNPPPQPPHRVGDFKAALAARPTKRKPH